MGGVGACFVLFLVSTRASLFSTPPTLTHTLPSLHAQVLPSLQGQHGDFLLTEMWTRWSNTRVMQRWLARFFNYLDR